MFIFCMTAVVHFFIRRKVKMTENYSNHVAISENTNQKVNAIQSFRELRITS